MTNDQSADDGRGQLKSLLPDTALPPQLRDRVLRSFALRHPSRRSPSFWRTVGALIAAAIIFALGLTTGRLWPVHERVANAAPRYALLLYDGAGIDTTSNDVTEHQTWARELARAGKLIEGEKLDRDVIDLAYANSPAMAPLRGFFIITAPSTRAAVEIARTLPHFQHGGRVIVRPIDRT